MSVQAGTVPINQQQFMQQQTPGQTPYGMQTAGQTPYGMQTAGQTPYGMQTPFQQGSFSQAPTGALAPQIQGQPGQQIQGQLGQQQWIPIAPVVSEVTLRVVSAALATITEQVRADPQALQTLCAQGQLTPQAYANILVESARRCAPIVAGAFGAISTGIGQQYAGQTPYGQSYGSVPGSPISQFG